ncbi:MAG: hydroxymethylbilane synthase, partial [Jatrophihabitantaceae bacterium]|nr:hydroxymethylbilane synthase [Jatrophihabitantaceae bacterium]
MTRDPAAGNDAQAPHPGQATEAGRANIARVRIGTRASALARTQTNHVVDALRALDPGTPLELEIVHIVTEGDRSTAPLAQIGGTGVFVSALRDALLDVRIDIAVHSYKDLPTTPEPGLAIGAVPVREDPRD